jgi:chromatin remodeling complex protein RSC6
MRWQEMQLAKALKEKREREARLKKEREAVWAAHLEREAARIKREKKELFERVAAETRAIRKEKEEEEKKRKATAKAKAKAKGPCLSE